MQFFLGIYFSFAMVKRFDSGYSKDDVVFGIGYFDKVVELCRMRNHIKDFCLVSQIDDRGILSRSRCKL